MGRVPHRLVSGVGFARYAVEVLVFRRQGEHRHLVGILDLADTTVEGRLVHRVDSLLLVIPRLLVGMGAHTFLQITMIGRCVLVTVKGMPRYVAKNQRRLAQE